MAGMTTVTIEIQEIDGVPEYRLTAELIKKSLLQTVLQDLLDRLEDEEVEGLQYYPADETENEEDPLN
jgi:hypothetical protein